MSIIDNKNKLERLDHLIRIKATGTPEELACKFDTTKRTIYRTINELKEIGCPIYYSKERDSYCYKYEGKLIIKFESLDKDVLNKINGGFVKSFFMSDKICHQPDLDLHCETENSFTGYPTPNIKVGFKKFLKWNV